MRILFIILFSIFGGLQYKIWLGDGGVLAWKELEKKIVHQKELNASLASRNKAVEEDILELKSGDQALEEQARYELGMVKNDEIYYQFVE